LRPDTVRMVHISDDVFKECDDGNQGGGNGGDNNEGVVSGTDT